MRNDMTTEELAEALYNARHAGMSNIIPWDETEERGEGHRDFWLTTARNFLASMRRADALQDLADVDRDLIA